MVTHEMNTEGMLIWAGPGPSTSRELVETAARELNLAVRFCTYKELLDLLHTERCHVACIELGFDAHPGLTLLKSVVERMPRLTTVVASNDTSVSMIRAVLEAGAADFLSLPLNPQELNKALIKLSQTALKGPSARGQAVGNIITVCGARGGLGATTLAVNLAFSLTTLTRADVALVDLDLQRGDVAAFLNMTPLNSIATIAEAKGAVDDIFLAGTLTRHPRGVFVLPAPTQVEEADAVGHDHVELTLQLLRAQFSRRAHGERAHAGRVRAVRPHPHPDRSVGAGSAGGPAHDRAAAAPQRVGPAHPARVLARDPRSRDPAGRGARDRQGAAPHHPSR